MKQRWLVPSDNQWAGRVVRRRHASIVSGVLTGRRDRVGGDVVSPVAQCDACNSYVTGTEDMLSFRRDSCTMTQRRVGQDTAIMLWDAARLGGDGGRRHGHWNWGPGRNGERGEVWGQRVDVAARALSRMSK